MRIFTILLFIPFLLFSQPWHYDFGTGTGSWTSGVSETFLPQPPSGNDRVRIGGGGGSFNLDNPGLVNLGSGSELRGVAPTGGSVNKFSIYDYDGGTGFTIRFYIQLDGGNSGQWYFFQGDGDTYSNNNGFSTAQVFSGIKWSFGDNNSITTSYKKTSSGWTTLNGVMAEQGKIYQVDIYGNNGASTINYHYNNQEYSVAPNKWDLWVDGTLVGDDLNKAGLSDGNVIDSYMFYGANSTGNVATIYLDDIYYTNVVSDQSLPVTLSSFNAIVQNNTVLLKWRTESEVENLGFEIYRSQDADGDYQLLSSYKDNPQLKGQFNASMAKQYQYTDYTAQSGQTYYYKLADVSVNGEKTFHGPLKVLVVNNQDIQVVDKTPTTFKLYPSHPNPFNPSTDIVFDLPANKQNILQAHLDVYNCNGQKVRTLLNASLQSGKQYQIHWDGKSDTGATLPAGIYFAVLRAGQFQQSIKMCMVK